MDTRKLLDEPFTFTQYRPLLSAQFISEARKCGFRLAEEELEAFHRVRLLVPIYRVARDGRAIAAAYRRGEDAYHLAHWQPTSRAGLVGANEEGRLHDPADEPFIARRRLKRPLGEWSYQSSVYLYARHQLIALPLLRQARPALRLKRARGDFIGRLDATADVVALWRERATRLRQIAGAATLLEPAYYARIFHRLSLPVEDFAAFDRWRRRRPLLRPLGLLGLDAGWIKDAAETLHFDAHIIDPLGPWAEVVAAGEPEQWKRLSGEARAALELRVSAEILLLSTTSSIAPAARRPCRRRHHGRAGRSTTASSVAVP